MKHILIIIIVTLFIHGKDLRKDQNDPAFKIYFQAYEYVLDENWSSAIKSFDELTKKYKKSEYYDDAFYWIAYATNEKGDFEKAYDLYQSFMSKFPNSNLKENALRDIKIIAQSQISKGNNRSKYEKMLKEYSDARSESEVDLELQESALLAIYNQGGKSSVEKLYKIVMNKSRPEEIREKALFWLGQSGSFSIKQLLEIYESVESFGLKEKCLFAISQKHGKESQEVLLKISLDESSQIELRKKAIFWMSQTDVSTMLPYIDILLEKLTESSLREKIIFSLSQMKTEKSNQRLTKIAFDNNEQFDVRQSAIFWLGQNGDISNLKKIYLQIDDQKLKEKLIFGFSQSKSEEAIDFMIKLLKLKTTSVKIKKNIIFWLGQSNHPKSKKAIQDILEN